MPLPTPTQHIAPDGVAFDQAMIVGPIDDQRPFVDDLAHVVSTEPHSCDRVHYTAPALSTLHPTRPGFYFVGDTDHRTEELGDVHVWARRWATIPAARVVPVGSYAYRFPGLPVGTVGSPLTITAMSPGDGTDQYIESPVFTSAAHGLAVGTRVRLNLVFASATVAVSANIVEVTTNTFRTTGILVFVGSGSIGAWSSGTATKVELSRRPDTIAADAVEAYSYALPGVTSGIATAADFRADALFKPVDATGLQVDTLGGATVPTASDYRALVASGAYLVAESAITRYLGQILERRTLLVRYT